MDLSLREPRWVAVRFEMSPRERPGQTDTVYSPALAAWLEPGEGRGEMRVTVSGDRVEAQLLYDYDPVAGSFSDFVWTFDAGTGAVLSARVDGRLWHRLGWGTSIQAPIQVLMSSQRVAGFAGPRTLLGHEYRRYCRSADARCTVVAPRAYDRGTGYVNAVGEILARSGPFQVRTFSPLGEAIFSELPAEAGALARVPPASPNDLAPVSSSPPVR